MEGDEEHVEAHAEPSKPDAKKPDGRKKPERTEAQKAATRRMMEARHEKEKTKGKLEISKNYDPDNIAIAELWYSNHELAKKERRAKKMKELEDLITSKLDSYHSKLMDELQKPIDGALEHYLTAYEDQEEPPAAQAVAEDLPPEEEPYYQSEPRRKRNYSLRQPRNVDRDWSIFL